ncbi:unnamed protein product [Brugia timori]|uniref:Uncharacterized protein n=1 Tax=Brugia timori TaxID=42155 RepID=A0A3P7X6A2_9BILA|nr:unnamed protein product [Brugia timori]
MVPANFDGRETYARGLLDPTEDTRLVTNLKFDYDHRDYIAEID